MPLTLPGTGIALTRANFADVVKTFVDNLETSINSVSTTANNALSTANAKYTKPAQGVPLSDIVTDGLTVTCVWNGTAFVTPAGVTVTAANRAANTRRIFIGGNDANALGLMVDGDHQIVPA